MQVNIKNKNKAGFPPWSGQYKVFWGLNRLKGYLNLTHSPAILT